MVFWVQVDGVNRSAANSRKANAASCAPCAVLERLSYLRPNASPYRIALKRLSIESSKLYQTVRVSTKLNNK